MAEEDRDLPEEEVQLEAPTEGGDEQQWSTAPAVLMGHAVQETIWNHAESDTAREVGGLLVGRVLAGDDGPMVVVEDALPARHAEAGSAHVTFTHESWSEWYQLLDEQYEGLQIVGWYHSHPNFGIFLSDHDLFI
ncbi:MAG: Mov34/MPN/PAD-1 family protein, partial [Armatimonadetes bacterium]|nr:Mov34/MPN/PAD-1 family protein [Armatimonadota bacterium]